MQTDQLEQACPWQITMEGSGPRNSLPFHEFSPGRCTYQRLGRPAPSATGLNKKKSELNPYRRLHPWHSCSRAGEQSETPGLPSCSRNYSPSLFLLSLCRKEKVKSGSGAKAIGKMEKGHFAAYSSGYNLPFFSRLHHCAELAAPALSPSAPDEIGKAANLR